MLHSLSLLLSLVPISLANYDLQPRAVRDASSSSALSGSMVSSAWYAGWHATDLPLSAISWSKYTELSYAFAVTTPDPNVILLAESDQNFLPQFVEAAHKNKVKASLSIGGWTGSRWFSTNVESAQNRTVFAKSVVGLVSKYKLDGIEFDWEYPGRQGVGCNTINPNDTTNFLSFLQELRKNLGPNITLTAATEVVPFSGPSGAPSKDVSGFSKVLDYITIMNYDIKSTPSTGVGPNSPLNDTCAPSGSRFGSATSAVAAWTAAGMPVNQIVLGVPTYGHSFRVARGVAFESGSNTTLAPYPAYDINNKPTGDASNGEGGLDVCGVYQGPGGIYAYRSLAEDGFLNPDGSIKDGIAYRYDNCSETPYAYNPQTEVMVTFDNAQSFAAKGDFIKTMGLKGFAMWEIAGDSNNFLINAILNGTVNGASRPQTSTTPSSSTTPPKAAASSSASRIHPRTPSSYLSFNVGPISMLILFFCSWLSL